jgi:hypothetical protein
MSGSGAITGAEWLARTLAANGTTHVFFIDAVLRRTAIEPGTLDARVGARREIGDLHGRRVCADCRTPRHPFGTISGGGKPAWGSCVAQGVMPAADGLRTNS